MLQCLVDRLVGISDGNVLAHERDAATFLWLRGLFDKSVPDSVLDWPYVEVELPDLDDNANVSFTLTLNGDETASISHIVI